MNDTRTEMANVYVAGDWLIAAAVAGFGGVYREIAGWERVRFDEAEATAAIERQLARSDIESGALSRHPPLSGRRSAFGEARRLARQGGASPRLFRVLREGRDLTVFIDAPAPDGRGYVGGDEVHVGSLRELWDRLRAAVGRE
jgi:hypothetical protein